MNKYQAVIGQQKKYEVYAYAPAQAQYQIEQHLTGRTAREAQREEYALWLAGGKQVAEVKGVE